MNIVQISSDTYWYLKIGEDMLDEDNMEEAKEILARFPDFAGLSDDYEDLVDEPGYVECEVLLNDWDGEHRFYTQGDTPCRWVTKFKLLGNGMCRAKFYDEQTGKVIHDGEFEVRLIRNKPWIIFGKNSMTPIWEGLATVTYY